jgi:hypothetical protein
MEKCKPFLLPEGVDKGGLQYWQALKDGYQLIEHYRKALAGAERAPMYYARGFNQDGEPYGITENLAPWDAVDEAADLLAKSKAAVRIMNAHKFTIDQVSPQGGACIRNAEGELVRSRDLFVLKKGQKNG